MGDDKPSVKVNVADLSGLAFFLWLIMWAGDPDIIDGIVFWLMNP